MKQAKTLQTQQSSEKPVTTNKYSDLLKQVIDLNFSSLKTHLNMYLAENNNSMLGSILSSNDVFYENSFVILSILSLLKVDSFF